MYRALFLMLGMLPFVLGSALPWHKDVLSSWRTIKNGDPATRLKVAPGKSYDFVACNSVCTNLNGGSCRGGFQAGPLRKSTRFTGDKADHRILIPHTKCILVVNGPVNDLQECIAGDDMTQCRPLTPPDASPDSNGTMLPAQCRWSVDNPNERFPGLVPFGLQDFVRHKVLVCDAGGAENAKKSDNLHWVRAGLGKFYEPGSPDEHLQNKDIPDSSVAPGKTYEDDPHPKPKAKPAKVYKEGPKAVVVCKEGHATGKDCERK